MTGILDTDAFRTEFPMTETWAYLDHATFGPLPTRTKAAVNDVTDQFASPADLEVGAGSVIAPYGAALERARSLVASLVNGNPDNVAFGSSASDSMNLAASGIDWQPGDNVVVVGDDHPSVTYPFLNLRRMGVEINLARPDANGYPHLDGVAEAITPQTKAVAISDVQYVDGYRTDLAGLGKLCRDLDVLSLVDATQSMGVQPIDVEATGIDVVLAHGYKWLLSSFGLAAIHFSDRALERIHPVRIGQQGMTGDRHPGPEMQVDLADTAVRFQTGWVSWFGIAAFNASAGWLVDIGTEKIAAHTLALTDQLIAGLDARGYRMDSSRDALHRSQIINFSTGDRDRDTALVPALQEKHVKVVLRPRGIRVSPHFYNSPDDIDRLLEALP